MYEIPGYRKAERSKNHDEEVDIINDFIRRETRLQKYFLDRGLTMVMRDIFKITGDVRYNKQESPKVILEFYAERKKLNWFDRTQNVYVQGWRIQENGMWGRGEESAQLGVQAIEDVLYLEPGFRVSEINGDRNEQLKIIRNLIARESNLMRYFGNSGLWGMMKRLIDSSGKSGLRKQFSVKALLEFYSERKGLGWFDQSKSSFITGYKKNNLGVEGLKVVYQNAA